MKVTGTNKINLFQDVNDMFIDHNKVLVSEYSKAKELKNEDIYLSLDGVSPIVKEDDMAKFPFRQLSATVVGAGTWKCTDFSNERMLKKSMSLMKGIPIYRNHEMVVGNEVGYVGEPKWTKSYTNKKGVTIPAGIDAENCFDSVLYPDLVRKMSGPNPYVKSSSVTCVFDWEASHDFEDENDFYWKLGSYHDGEMVRRVVKKITEYYESSLVWLGADPFAGILDQDGEVRFVDNKGIVELSATASERVLNEYSADSKFFVRTCIENNKSLSLDKPKESGNNEENMEIINLVAEKLGLPVESVTEQKLKEVSFLSTAELDELKARPKNVEESDQFKSVFADLEAQKGLVAEKDEELTSLNAEKETLTAEKIQLEADVASLKPNAEIGESVLGKRVSYAKEMYTKSVNGNVNDQIMQEIEAETSFEKLEAKIEMFGGKAFSSFGAKCKSCGHHEIEFRSSLEEDPDGAPKAKEASFAKAILVNRGRNK